MTVITTLLINTVMTAIQDIDLLFNDLFAEDLTAIPDNQEVDTRGQFADINRLLVAFYTTRLGDLYGCTLYIHDLDISRAMAI